MIDRRRFVASSAAAAALPPTFTRSRAAADKKAVKLGMVAGELRQKSLAERFQVLADLGFDGVELNSPNKLDRAEVLAARDQSGLTIPGVVDSVHWRQTLNHPRAEVRSKGLAGLRTAIEDCKAYGGTSVLLVPGVVNKQHDYATCYKRSQAAIREVLPMCAELGIQIALENVWNNFLLSPVECARYIDELESKWVGMHFDPGNVVKFGWPEHWVRSLGKRIIKMDVKDFRRKGNTFNVLLTEGDTDWAAVRRELKTVGYQGWYTAEIKGGGRTWLSDVAARMDKILAM